MLTLPSSFTLKSPFTADQPVPSCTLPILAVMYYAIVKWSLEGDNEILDGYDDREDAFEALDNYQDRYPDGYLDVVKIGK